MSGNPVELYNDGTHKCFSFNDLVTGEGIQSNQFLIVHSQHEAVIDPGGNLTYMPLTIAISRHIQSLRSLDYVLASHQDPDIIASMDRWLLNTDATIVTSKLWSRFLPHLSSDYQNKLSGIDPYSRILAIEDSGQDIPFGETVIKALPAHFLHSVGNIQFYDPISKILFSGDMGASVGSSSSGNVSDFQAHIPLMKGFHQRYMCSNKVCRLWANMIRKLDVQMIVPQHGPHFGSDMVEPFLDWISDLQCGVDLLTQENYRIP